MPLPPPPSSKGGGWDSFSKLTVCTAGTIQDGSSHWAWNCSSCIWAPSSMQNLPSSSARVDIFPCTHAAHLLTPCTDKVPQELKYICQAGNRVRLVVIQYVRPTTFPENRRNSSVFQKHFKFMFHLALPHRLSRCLTRPPVQRASFANLNKF